MNKRGDFTGVIYLIVTVAILAIFLLIVGFIVPQITEPFMDKIGISPEINNSFLASSNIAEHTLPTIWLIVFGGLMLGLFATSFFIEAHPIFVPIFALLLIIAIVIAIPLSNAYEELAADANLAGAAAQQGLIGFIMFNLPLVAFIVGILSLVIAFAKPGQGGATLG